MPENILCYVEEGKAGRSRSNTNKGAMLGLSGRRTSCARGGQDSKTFTCDICKQ